jgi:hypothetical protein
MAIANYQFFHYDRKKLTNTGRGYHETSTGNPD